MTKKRASKTRILIVDDHPIVRDGLSQRINNEDDMEVCGEAENASQAIKKINDLHPDVAIVDINLGGRNGIELLKDLRSQHICLPVIVLSVHDEVIYAERALRSGANAYITKHDASGVVISAIRRVRAGEVFVSEKMATTLLTRLLRQGSTETSDNPMGSMSEREREVFEMIGRDRTVEEIAVELGMSTSTVHTHRSNIKTKLAITSRQLTTLARSTVSRQSNP